MAKEMMTPKIVEFPAGLSQPTLRALAGAGIHNLNELSHFSQKEISKLHGLGPSGLERLSQAMAENSLGFVSVPGETRKTGKTQKDPQPTIEERPAQPYAAVRLQVPFPFGKYLQPAWSKVGAWLAGQGLPHGPAIIRYLTTDMSAMLDIDVGFTIERLIPAGKGLITATLPAGKYACLTHIGSYRGNGVYKANVVMVEWAKRNRIPWMVENKSGVEWWDSRVEWYPNDPAVDPDPKSYKTELTFRVMD